MEHIKYQYPSNYAYHWTWLSNLALPCPFLPTDSTDLAISLANQLSAVRIHYHGIYRVHPLHQQRILGCEWEGGDRLPLHAQRSPQHLLRQRRPGSTEPHIPRRGLVKEDDEMDLLLPNVLDLMRVRHRHDVDVPGLQDVRVHGAVGIHDGHARRAAVHVAHLDGRGVPVDLTHPFVCDVERVECDISKGGPELRAGQFRGGKREFEGRILGLDVELVCVGEPRCFRDRRGALSLDDVFWCSRAGDDGPSLGGLGVGVSEDGIGKSAEGSREGEIDGEFVAGGAD